MYPLQKWSDIIEKSITVIIDILIDLKNSIMDLSYILNTHDEQIASLNARINELENLIKGKS